MKNVKLNGLLIMMGVGLMLLTQGCSKEQGCTDLDAVNYSSTAEEEDGSCTFSGRAVFWYGETAATNMLNDGITSLTFYLDGEVVGSSDAAVYFTSTPDCDNGGAVVATRDLGDAKSKSFTYKVVAQDGFKVGEVALTLEANTCIIDELTY